MRRGWMAVVRPSRGGFRTVVPDDLLAMLRRCLSDGHEDYAWAYAVALEMLTDFVMDHRQWAAETHGNTCGRGRGGENKEGKILYGTGAVKGRCLEWGLRKIRDRASGPRFSRSVGSTSRYGVRRRDRKSERGRSGGLHGLAKRNSTGAGHGGEQGRHGDEHGGSDG